MDYFGLVDCNNFYVSCERVFNPALKNVPVAVLSNNDGCIVARSAFVKALGIPMGAAFFKYKSLLAKHNVQVFSSNYALYGDMSTRVMHVINQTIPYVQVYSIDEAFLLFKNMELDQAVAQSQELQAKLLQWTGIPVSIGIAPTKTLAKVANKYAKKYMQLNGVFGIDDKAHINWLLEHFDVHDIWGVGRQYTKKLKRHGIHNALQLTQADDSWVRKNMTICGLKTVWELRGFVCYPLDSITEPQKGVACTRSFGKPVNTLKDIKEAVASHTAHAAEKARAQQSAVAALYVFIHTNYFDQENWYSNGATITLPIPSAYTPELITYAHKALYSIYRPGLNYKRAGVMFVELVDMTHEQLELFAQQQVDTSKRTLMNTVDIINRKWGRNTLSFAAQGIKQPWSSKQKMKKSQRYTTSWHELLHVH